MLDRDTKDMIEGEHAEGEYAERGHAKGECAKGRHAEGEYAVSNGVEPVDVFIVLGSPLDLGKCLEDELKSDILLADLVLS